MKKSLFLALIPFWYTLNSCILNTSDKEDLHSAKSHIEDSIIHNIPMSTRFCDKLDETKQLINIGDCELYCETEGEGVPLVLIHGGPGGTHHCFHPWLSDAKDKFKIIYYDQRGCGLSDFSAGEGYSFEQTVDDLEKLRIALKIDKWVVLGHSFGGGVAQYYTIKYPQNVLGMVLVGSVPMINRPELVSQNENWALNADEKAQVAKVLQLVMDGKLNYAQYFYNDAINGGWKRQNFYKPLQERFSQLANFDIAFDPNFNSDYGVYDFEHAFETCPIPTLICEGKYDSLWSAKKVPVLLKNFPNAKFRSFEYSSHNIYSDEPKLFVKEVEQWVKEIIDVDANKIANWKVYTNKLLDEQIRLISSTRTFVKLTKKDDLEEAINYYSNFKKKYPDKPLFTENAIANAGYHFLQGGKTKLAMELFELYVKEYPKSWNAYDCLGEACMKMNKKQLAITNYKKSLELNPQNSNAVKMLEQIK